MHKPVKPVNGRKRLRKSGDSSSDSEDDRPCTGESPLKDPPSALGKQGLLLLPVIPTGGRFADLR